jgi:hypothetical protein
MPPDGFIGLGAVISTPGMGPATEGLSGLALFDPAHAPAVRAARRAEQRNEAILIETSCNSVYRISTQKFSDR